MPSIYFKVPFLGKNKNNTKQLRNLKNIQNGILQTAQISKLECIFQHFQASKDYLGNTFLGEYLVECSSVLTSNIILG